jgi:aminoglycoside phosphotransferase (APT) family kinase protein
MSDAASGASASSATPGYDVPAVEAWIAGHTDRLEPPFTWTRLHGGHSNLTFHLRDAQGREAVIRRPPMGVLLPKAHDMAREWALISALGPTPVPVPDAIGFCDDDSVTGAKFYVMGHIDGHPLYTQQDTHTWIPDESKRRLTGESFIDVLADLHALDPDALGLSDLGKKDDYIGRQLKTWYRSWMASIEGAKFDDPRAHELQRYFLANAPDQGPARVVHGDYGLHNTLIGPDGAVAAVVDWEISTLGDPMADLAYALNQWYDDSDATERSKLGPTNLPGFSTRAALAERYAKRSGRDLSRLDFYVGFNRWKTAAIIHGVYARYMEGKKSAEGVDLGLLMRNLEDCLRLSEEAVERLERRGARA